MTDNKLTGYLETVVDKGPWSPALVLPVETRAELNAQLDFYGVPFFRFAQPYERKFYMENLRPALRYYCLKYAVDIPEWLEEETHFGHGDGEAEEMMEMFGVPQLDPSNWDEWMPHLEQENLEEEDEGEEEA